MTEIYIIRHTEAEGNLYKVMQGYWDGDVTSLGFKEIDALARRFKDVKLDAVYSSDLYRACLTASALTRYNRLPIFTDKRIREINVGPLEGTFFGNTMHENPVAMKIFLEHPWQWHLAGADTLEDVSKRACEAVREIADKNDGKSVAVVSHGMTIKCILTKLLGYALEGEDSAPIVKNTAVSKLIYKDGKFTAEYVADASHLEGLEVTDWVQKDLLWDEEFNPLSDEEHYKKCYKDAWSFAHGGNTDKFYPDLYLSSSVKHFENDKRAVLKLYFEEKEAGLLDLDILKGKEQGYGWISLLYLFPEFRFKRFGIQILGRAIMHYYSLGRKAVRLNVAASNEAAVHFYSKYGFDIIETESGAEGPLYLMEKRLDERIKIPLVISK